MTLAVCNVRNAGHVKGNGEDGIVLFGCVMPVEVSGSAQVLQVSESAVPFGVNFCNI